MGYTDSQELAPARPPALRHVVRARQQSVLAIVCRRSCDIPTVALVHSQQYPTPYCSTRCTRSPSVAAQLRRSWRRHSRCRTAQSTYNAYLPGLWKFWICCNQTPSMHAHLRQSWRQKLEWRRRATPGQVSKNLQKPTCSKAGSGIGGAGGARHAVMYLLSMQCCRQHGGTCGEAAGGAGGAAGVRPRVSFQDL